MSDLDAAWANTPQFRRRVDAARRAIEEVAPRAHYAGCSWGKDSVCLAHLISQLAPQIPIVTTTTTRTNPDSMLVEREFLGRFSVKHYSYEIQHAPSGGSQSQSKIHDEQFRLARELFGSNYFSGVRAAESAARKMRGLAGTTTEHTCAPLIQWSGMDVFAYLHMHDLPIHPAYACTLGGRLDRDRIRVGNLGGLAGSGVGRVEWERAYYP